MERGTALEWSLEDMDVIFCHLNGLLASRLCPFCRNPHKVAGERIHDLMHGEFEKSLALLPYKFRRTAFT